MEIFEGLEHIVRSNEPLAPHTWLRLGGPAQFFAEPTSIEELQNLLRRCREEDMPVRILGGGSNLLVRDEGVPGLVLSLAAPPFTQISVERPQITAGGGARLGHAGESDCPETKLAGTAQEIASCDLLQEFKLRIHCRFGLAFRAALAFRPG